MLIQEPGHTWVTDLGRLRGASVAFPANGALDHGSARVANILVGNPEDAPLLEALHRGLSFLAEEHLLFSVTGAECTVTIDDVEAPAWTPLSARPGQTVRIGSARKGLRIYVAVRGEFDVPRLMGSCAPDSMIAFGTRLTAGLRLGGVIETPPLSNPYFELPVMRLPVPRAVFEDAPVVPVTDGPDYAEFGDTAELLFSGSFTVGARSNHVGLRLSGELPTRQTHGEILSRGVPVGAIEVPSQEGLLVLHRGRGVTAGYPVLSVVTALGLDQIGQLQPGQEVRFRRVTIEEAREAYLARHGALARLQKTVREVLDAHGVPLSPTPAHPRGL